MTDRHQEMRGGRLMQLTEEAQAEHDDFDAEYGDRGCTCFVSPPCSYCTHPGNPQSLENWDDGWEPVEETAEDRDIAGMVLISYDEAAEFTEEQWAELERITKPDTRGPLLMKACDVVERQMKPTGWRW